VAEYGHEGYGRFNEDARLELIAADTGKPGVVLRINSGCSGNRAALRHHLDYTIKNVTPTTKSIFVGEVINSSMDFGEVLVYDMSTILV
jgi:hypothetical protein